VPLLHTSRWPCSCTSACRNAYRTGDVCIQAAHAAARHSTLQTSPSTCAVICPVFSSAHCSLVALQLHLCLQERLQDRKQLRTGISESQHQITCTLIYPLYGSATLYKHTSR
jgi:hypothetical protein